jgi:hypothetical protein
MNKSQRILTILALTVFVAIGACHYLALRSYSDYSGGKYAEETRWREPTAEELIEAARKAKDTGIDFLPNKIPVTVRVPLADQRWYLQWEEPKYAMLPEVKMPWFMLGVIYTGFFFLMQDKRNRS